MDPPTVHRQRRKRSASDEAEKNNQDIIDDNDVIDDEAVMPMEAVQPALTLDEDIIMVRRVCVCVCSCWEKEEKKTCVWKLRMNHVRFLC